MERSHVFDVDDRNQFFIFCNNGQTRTLKVTHCILEHACTQLW